MYPEDRVLVAYVATPTAFHQIRENRWYHIPVESAPKGIFSEYVAFYFGRSFGPDKWAIHFYAENRGHELVRRLDLFPDQTDHPRANDLYFKLQLGPIRKRGAPIVNLRWRRLLFLHTTWDRFCQAAEVRDLLTDGEGLTNRPEMLREKATGVPAVQIRRKDKDS